MRKLKTLLVVTIVLIGSLMAASPAHAAQALICDHNEHPIGNGVTPSTVYIDDVNYTPLSGAVMAVARGTDNQIWYNTLNYQTEPYCTGQWYGWQPIGGVTYYAPDVEDISGLFRVAAIDTNGHVQTITNTGPDHWTAWTLYSGTYVARHETEVVIPLSGHLPYTLYAYNHLNVDIRYNCTN